MTVEPGRSATRHTNQDEGHTSPLFGVASQDVFFAGEHHLALAYDQLHALQGVRVGERVAGYDQHAGDLARFQRAGLLSEAGHGRPAAGGGDHPSRAQTGGGPLFDLVQRHTRLNIGIAAVAPSYQGCWTQRPVKSRHAETGLVFLLTALL